MKKFIAILIVGLLFTAGPAWAQDGCAEIPACAEIEGRVNRMIAILHDVLTANYMYHIGKSWQGGIELTLTTGQKADLLAQYEAKKTEAEAEWAGMP